MSLQDKMNVSAKPALKSLKTEVANELGLADYEQADKGNLTAQSERLRGRLYDQETGRNGRTADVRKINSLLLV